MNSPRQSAALHPCLLTGDEVRAIMENRKTQFRVPVMVSNSYFDSASREFWKHCDLSKAWPDEGYIHVPSHTLDESRWNTCQHCIERGWEGTAHRLYPRWEVGDRLWVRETWAESDDKYGSPIIVYRADNEAWYIGIDDKRLALCNESWTVVGWSPSIHMPRWASRLTLEITDIRVERDSEGRWAWAITFSRVEAAK